MSNMSLPSERICCPQTVTLPSGKSCRSTKHFRFLKLAILCWKPMFSTIMPAYSHCWLKSPTYKTSGHILKGSEAPKTASIPWITQPNTSGQQLCAKSKGGEIHPSTLWGEPEGRAGSTGLCRLQVFSQGVWCEGVWHQHRGSLLDDRCFWYGEQQWNG